MTWLSWAGGFTLGALTNLHPKPLFVIGSIITLSSLVALIARAIGSARRSDLSGWDEFLRQPDEHAAKLVARANEHFLVVGQVVETIPHPSLNTRADVGSIGWDPEEIVFNDAQQRFEDKKLLDQTGGYREFDPPNGVKFCLYDTSFITLDSPVLALELHRTDYFTLMSILPTVRADPELRARFGSVQPVLSRIPHSVCLHYVVRFAGGELLCMRRHRKAAYHANLWSFSGEEQLSESDFLFNTTALSLFQRAFCEEVIALRDHCPSTLAERWERARPLIKNMRLWSVFLEEQIFNFSIFGFYQLEVTPREFVAFHNDLINRGAGTKDGEGDFFVITPTMLKNLVFKNRCVVNGLFTPGSERFSAESLHPTSRYRVFRTLRAINRRPLEPEPL